MANIKAKAKANTNGKPAPGRAARTHRVRDAALLVRATPEWKAAVERLAELDRATSVSELIDRAVVEYARVRGHDVTIPTR